MFDVLRHVAARLRTISQGGQLVAVLRQGGSEQELGVGRRNARKTCHPCCGHLLQDSSRVRELIVDHQPPADGDMRVQQGHAHHVKEREDDHLDIVRRQLQVFDDAERVGHDVGVREHDAFRLSRGAGRVDDRRAGLRVDREIEVLIGIRSQFLIKRLRSGVPVRGSCPVRRRQKRVMP